jgi:circadian clock protein KaiB
MKIKAPKLIGEDKFILQLYVSGMSPRSMEAIKNLKRFCDQYLKDAFELEVIDIYKNPTVAAEHHIVFCPSLIKHQPLPKKILIGNLSDTEKVIKALGITFKE